jgi:HEAT repeat protein
LSSVYFQLYLAGLEVRNLLAGRTYDSRVIDSPDKSTRWAIAAELLAALFSQDFEEQERARQIFIDHGYFDEATRGLKTAESPADRAAAARKLGMVGSHLATAHLIAALFDEAPEVRRAAAEALIQIGDPWVANAPLNAILTDEITRDLPEVPEPTGRVADNMKLDETASAQLQLRTELETGFRAAAETLHAVAEVGVRQAEVEMGCCVSETEEETQRLAEELAQIEAAARRARAVPTAIAAGLNGADASERAAALADLARIGNNGALSLMTCLDDDSPNVLSVAARALFQSEPHRTPESFSQALEEGSPERRRKIGAAMAASSIATKATSNLTGSSNLTDKSREDSYNALCLLYVMEVERAGRKADEEAQRLAEKLAQIEVAEAALCAEAEERGSERGSIPVSESVGDNSGRRSLARRFLLRFARRI